jgi:hypothetical protein
MKLDPATLGLDQYPPLAGRISDLCNKTGV